MLRHVIEDQARKGWPDIPIAADDGRGATKLANAMSKARHERLTRREPGIAVWQERVKKLHTASLRSQLRHVLRDGRGLALVVR
jgi:hypothetical protein